jgi:hypothetical protein
MRLLGFLIRLLGAALLASHAGAHEEGPDLHRTSFNSLGGDRVAQAEIAVETNRLWWLEATSP